MIHHFSQWYWANAIINKGQRCWVERLCCEWCGNAEVSQV